MKLKDMAGQRYGKLTVLDYDQGLKKWRCRCDCGGIKYNTRSNLLYGYGLMCKQCDRRTRRVRCVETGKVYGSAAEAGREVYVTSSTIRNCAKGMLKSAAGRHWEFAD